MKHLKTPVIGAAIILVVSVVFFINNCAASKANKQQVESNGFAVLELFTSEGCSSCPPADNFLARVQKDAGDKPVYLLSYHVDYWNRLGWKDVFSNAKFSARQYEYSHRLEEQVYTPQVIINGKSGYVGSDEKSVNNAVANALKEQTSTSLKINGQQQAGHLDIEYEVKGNTGNNQLVIAVVQKHALSQVKRGENEGRTLSHAQIVHSLYQFDLKQLKGAVNVVLPKEFNSHDWEVIALVQQEHTGLIMAANRVAIASSANN